MKSLRHLVVIIACLASFSVSLNAADAPPPFDPRLPGSPPVTQISPAAPTAIPHPATAQPAANLGPLPAGILAFDSESKEATTKPGQNIASYIFYLTNVSPNEVVVNHVQTSCGCTTAQLPPMPWKIPAGGTGQIPVNMNVQGKNGQVFKTVTLQTDQGQKPLTVKANILPPDLNTMSAADRERNQLLAKADAQAIFKGDCARCHVQPVIGKTGQELYTAACGICHEAEHRATMVADLRNLPNDTSADYWKLMVTLGKPNTLMPAFSQAHGGPLSDAQVTSLVEYLVATMPAKGTNSRPVFLNVKH